MASGLLVFPGAQPSFGLDGERVSAELRFYLPNTTTPATVYQDSGLTTPHTFPVQSDAFGEFPLIYADDARSFTVNWITADGQTQTKDGISASTPANQAILDETQALRDETEGLKDDTAQLKSDTQDILDDATALYGSIAAVDAAVAASAASASAAAGSATTATTQAGIATTQAGNASTSATNAGTSATAAATSAAAAKGYIAALGYTFSTTTTDSDPGAGNLRLNHATPASATFLYIDNSDADGLSASAWLDTFDDSTSAIKGQAFVRDGVTGGFAIFAITGGVVDGGGYRKVPVSYIGGGGSFTNGNRVGLAFAPNGDAPSSASVGYAAKTTNYTVVSADWGKIIDVTSGSPTISFTAAATLGQGFWVYLKNSGTGTVTGPTVDGATLSLAPGDEALVESDGSSFHGLTIHRRGWTNVLSGASLDGLSVFTLSSIPSGYADFAFRFDYASGATLNATISVSSDGSNFSSSANLFGSGVAAGTVDVLVKDYRSDKPSVLAVISITPGASPAAAQVRQVGGAILNCTGGVSAIRIGVSTITTGTLYQPRAR